MQAAHVRCLFVCSFFQAGIGEKGTWLSVAKELDEDIDQEPAHDVINVDLIAVANTTRLAWYGMRKEKRNGGLKFGGSIILTASMAVSLR